MKRSESEQEKLIKQYAGKAKEDQGAIVSLLSQGLGIVLNDLNDDPRDNLIDMACLPASHLAELGLSEGHARTTQARSTEDGSWAGIAYLRGRRSLTISVDAFYLAAHTHVSHSVPAP